MASDHECVAVSPFNIGIFSRVSGIFAVKLGAVNGLTDIKLGPKTRCLAIKG
jgi:hypothetical protein